MTDFVADAARSAAAALAADHYQEVASLGGVTVSAANLAWAIYSDQRNATEGPRPEADSIAHQVRTALRAEGTGTILPPGTDRITEVVATEIIRQSNLAPE
jgi:hypothetical protein